MAAAQAIQQFSINVPKLSEGKRYSVMKFNLSLGVDVTAWKDPDTTISLERENNQRVFEYTNSDQPEFGAGSEYGRAARQEQRRKKLGIAAARYSMGDQPWLLKIGGKSERNFKGIREGGAGEHADYWIFKKSGEGMFDALPIEEWYNFMPIARYKTLGIDEAEEQFEKRNKVMNQFALKAQFGFGASKSEGDDAISRGAAGTSKQMKISDRDDFPSDDSDDGEGERKVKDEDPDDPKSKKKTETEDSKGKGGSKKKKKSATSKRRQKNEEKDEEDRYEGEGSEDGEEEGREVDYMSDSGSASDAEELSDTEKRGEEKGVDEESGLKTLLSDTEEDEGEEGGEGETTEGAQSQPPGDGKKKGPEDEKDSSEESDSDDPDKAEIKSALFLQDKSVKGGGGEKRPLDQTAESSAPLAKKPKKEEETHPSGITEEDVRRYLIRKPMSTKELISKLKPKTKHLSKEDVVKRLADIMKKLEPKKEHKDIKGKKTLLFSLSA